MLLPPADIFWLAVGGGTCPNRQKIIDLSVDARATTCHHEAVVRRQRKGREMVGLCARLLASRAIETEPPGDPGTPTRW